MNAGRDPDQVVEEWRDTSRRASMATGYRARPRAAARTSAALSIGGLAAIVSIVVVGLVLREASTTNSSSPSPSADPAAPVVTTAE
ncbi:MAG TPA: hypothetical protein VK697_11315, partial [Methylomirabilota bacterium]|nr:hypothetical protein [Methylomirabilota bacterium]